MSANVLKCRLLCIISDCAMNLVAAISAFVRDSETDCTAPDGVGWVLYGVADAATIFVSERHVKSLERGCLGNFLPGIAHAKVALLYVEDFRDVSISQVFT